MGSLEVPNPDWDGTNATSRTVRRDYRFGPKVTGSQVTLTPSDGGQAIVLEGTNTAQVPVWRQNRIVALVPIGTPPGEYQVTVTRGLLGATPAVESPTGVTLTVGICESNNPTSNPRCRGTEYGVAPNGDYYAVHNIAQAPYPATPIQEAIDAAAPGDLILVAPGVYDELVIMHKPVKLQGWGAGAVTLNARQSPTDKLNNWRTKVEQLVADGSIEPLPGQTNAPPGFPSVGTPLFPTEEGAGIFVAGSSLLTPFADDANQGARIDGFSIIGAAQGGGIMVNGYAGHMNIGNNRLIGNSGFYGGGIRVGHPTLTHDEAGVLVYDDAVNDNIRIHHNLVIQNGVVNSAGVGGGIGLMTGADNYKVQHNWVCGNFSQGSGAGLGHLGFSDGGLIEDNTVVFNESFSQQTAESGGGIYIGGQPGLQPIDGYLLSPGTGTVRVDANLIRGNLAGAGDGGGIRIENVNGEDVLANPLKTGQWDRVYLFNNMITNNVAGLAGGGVSIENSVSANFRYNTVANNDSTATTALAASGDPNVTLPQPAGIVARAHSGDFALLMADTPDPGNRDQDLFSNPELRSNITYHNRSFFWLNSGDGEALFPASCWPDACDPATDPDLYSDDLAVLGVAGGLLNPVYSLLTDATGYNVNNVSADPLFVRPYLNEPRDPNLPNNGLPQTAGAFDEGGNFVQVIYGPLTLLDTSIVNAARRVMFDYHLDTGSPAIDEGSPNNAGGVLGLLGSMDFDDDDRPGTASGVGGVTDIGADEVTP